MDASGSETSVRATKSFSGPAQLPPKKRALERGKEVLDESENNNHEIDSNNYKLPSIPSGMTEVEPTKSESALRTQELEKPLPSIPFGMGEIASTKIESALPTQEPKKPLPSIPFGMEEIAPTKLESALPIEEPEKPLPSIPFGIEEISPTKLELILPDQAPEKALTEQAPQKADIQSENPEPDKSFDIVSGPKKKEKGESSNNAQVISRAPPRAPRSVPKSSNSCKFCGQQFPNSQALGGHQNAHKHEREVQKALKAARRNPFGIQVASTRMEPLFYGSHFGQNSQFTPYEGYATRGLQTGSVYPDHRIDLVQSSPILAQDLVHYLRTLDQGHILGQPSVAQGLLRGQASVSQGILRAQASDVRPQPSVVRGQPSVARGLVQNQPSVAQSLIRDQPSVAEGLVRGQASVAQGLIRGLVSVAEGLVRGQATFSQGLGRGQRSVAQGLGRGQPSVAQGLRRGQPRVSQGVVRGQASVTQGVVHSQPRHAQGIVRGQPRNAHGVVSGHPNQARGLVQGQSSNAQNCVCAHGLEGFIGHSSTKPVNPEWPTSYASSSGQARANNGFNPYANSNLATFMQPRENEGNFAKRQCTGSSGLNLSLNPSQPFQGKIMTQDGATLKSPFSSAKDSIPFSPFEILVRKLGFRKPLM